MFAACAKCGSSGDVPQHSMAVQALSARGVLKPDTVRNVLIREVLASLKEKFATPENQVGFADGRVHRGPRR